MNEINYYRKIEGRRPLNHQEEQLIIKQEVEKYKKEDLEEKQKEAEKSEIEKLFKQL